jgi:hypothetical protein
MDARAQPETLARDARSRPQAQIKIGSGALEFGAGNDRAARAQAYELT